MGQELNNERLELLLDALKEYRYNKQTNEQVLNKLTRIIDELKCVHAANGNTVAYQNSRIKEENSYLNKINNKLNKGLDVTYENIHDIVGLRLVCLSLEDVYNFVDLLKKSNIKIVNEKDYIEYPKDSGYRGYHIIVEIPIENEDDVVQCEIQLRTIFMDIFAREEHKLSYKGNATNEEKKELRNLSDKLYFYDCAVDNLFRIENHSVKDEIEECEINLCKEEFNKISDLYNIVFVKINDKIREFVSEYENSSDILHINYRTKSIPSLVKKLKRKKLSCTLENIVTNIRDVIGFKIVCTDENIATNFIEYFDKKLESIEKIKISNRSNRLKDAKDSGYRGYKMNLSYPISIHKSGEEISITIEILIRTMAMDAWALHDDKIFNNEKVSNKTKSQLKGLSDALHDVESSLLEIKTNQETNQEPLNLVSIVTEYQNNKKKNAKTLKYTDEKKEIY